jgi:glucokinase
MNSYTTAIGIDIGRYQINSAVIKSSGELLIARATDLSGEQDRDYLIKVVADAVKQIRADAAEMRLNPVCTGISAKGFINTSTGVMIGPDRGIKGWRDVPLARLINRETSLPVYVGNDANLMTLAEHRLGAARGYKNVIFMSLRTGIGGGIIIDGKLYSGVNSAGGEFGQMIIDVNGQKNPCGIPGTLEYYASSQALVDSFLGKGGDPGDMLPANLRAKDVFDLHYQSNEVATSAVMENARFVGIGIANLISVFAPEIVVLGGGMARAGDDYINAVRDAAFANSLEDSRQNVVITRAKLGEVAAITGAALFAMARLGGKAV